MLGHTYCKRKSQRDRIGEVIDMNLNPLYVAAVNNSASAQDAVNLLYRLGVTDPGEIQAYINQNPTFAAALASANPVTPPPSSTFGQDLSGASGAVGTGVQLSNLAKTAAPLTAAQQAANATWSRKQKLN